MLRAIRYATLTELNSKIVNLQMSSKANGPAAVFPFFNFVAPMPGAAASFASRAHTNLYTFRRLTADVNCLWQCAGCAHLLACPLLCAVLLSVQF